MNVLRNLFGGSVGRFAATGVAALALPSGLWFHTHLTRATPGVNDTVAVAPTQVRLWFSQKPTVKLSRVTLTGAGNAKVPVGTARATDDTLSVAVPIQGTLKPGTYTVAWQTASKDGHPVRGRYQFTLGAGGKPAEAGKSAPEAQGDAHAGHSGHQ